MPEGRRAPGRAGLRIGGEVASWLGIVAAAATVGYGYAAATDAPHATGAVIGAAIGGLVSGFELFYVQSGAGAWLRRLPLALFIAATTTAWLVLISMCLHLVPLVMEDGRSPADGVSDRFDRDLIFSLVASLVFNFGLRVRGLIGGRVLVNFLLGRYHRPLREERIFMFLDLAGSTRLAERLGDVRTQELIGQFFFEIAGPVAAHGGETHRYIGDEVVVTWPLRDPRSNARCVECALEARALIAERAEVYRQRFGAAPEFRVGLHGGPVVASEVGDDKREIVYFGDTVNTASRLQGLCKELSRPLLISGSLLDVVELPPAVGTENLGEIAIAGREAPIEVCALYSRTGNG